MVVTFFQRTISILIDGVLSQSFSVNANVPHDPLLAPTLLFNNDFLTSTSSRLQCFSDEVTLRYFLSGLLVAMSLPISFGIVLCSVHHLLPI